MVIRRSRTGTVAIGHLSRREREIMDVIFALGNRASAEDVRARLTNPPSSSATRAMLARLEGKGLIRHTEDGPRFIYSATISPTRASRDALHQCIRVFFGGRREQLMATLLTRETWTDSELDALQREIDRVRREKEP